jgi:2-polyprenyl-3-methyl-5-hydroxy-6-metoxy-1,4-benzoquinol methylase
MALVQLSFSCRFFNQDFQIKYYFRQSKTTPVNLIRFLKRKTSQKHKFNQQFESKKWEGLRDIADLGRYSIIVGLTKYFCPNARILDLGCGEGVLLEKFAVSDYASYLGIDFSGVAIQNASKLANEKARFITGDLNKLEVTGQYDVIIYNESLYYLRDPKAAVHALFKNLAPGGVFIISMVDKHGKERENIWAELDEILALREKTKVANLNGDTWTIRTYKIKH